ncbi:hypothetical protein BH09VER1_BH09VER1_28000 [soil metagenome]
MTHPSQPNSTEYDTGVRYAGGVRQPRWLFVFLIGLCLFCAGTTRADLLVKEAFDYPIGEILDGQGGGMGFGDTWQHKYNGSADAKIVAGLTFSDYPVSGHAVQFHAETEIKSVSAIRRLDANFGSAPQPIWMSYLFTYAVNPGDKPAYYSGVSTSNNEYPDDIRFGVAALNGSNRFAVTYQTPSSSSGSKETLPSTTYLLIGKFVGGEGATMWALTEKDYDAIKAGGITEEKLNATNSGVATSKSVEEQADSLQEFLGMGASTFGDSSTLEVSIDELKLGSSLNDVTTSAHP